MSTAVEVASNTSFPLSSLTISRKLCDSALIFKTLAGGQLPTHAHSDMKLAFRQAITALRRSPRAVESGRYLEDVAGELREVKKRKNGQRFRMPFVRPESSM